MQALIEYHFPEDLRHPILASLYRIAPVVRGSCVKLWGDPALGASPCRAHAALIFILRRIIYNANPLSSRAIFFVKRQLSELKSEMLRQRCRATRTRTDTPRLFVTFSSPRAVSWLVHCKCYDSGQAPCQAPLRERLACHSASLLVFQKAIHTCSQRARKAHNP